MLTASVIIPTKNPGPIFRRVLAAVFNQKTAFEFEVVIIDSGSIDGTIEYIKDLNFKNLRLLEIDPQTFGHGKTRNEAIAATNSEFVVMLTHDACPGHDKWLTNLIELAQSNEKIAGIFGKHLPYEEANPFTANELKLHFQGFQSQRLYQLDDSAKYEREEGYRQFLHFFSDNNALLRRAVWNEIPYPDVDFAEDQIWAKKIIEAGWIKAYADNAPVFHSHNFSLWERLQRSFDESYAFLRIFGYQLQPTLMTTIKSWAILTVRDLRYAISGRVVFSDLKAVLRMPVDNLMRVIGQYLGTHGNRLSSSTRHALSRDKRVMRGLLNTTLQKGHFE